VLSVVSVFKLSARIIVAAAAALGFAASCDLGDYQITDGRPLRPDAVDGGTGGPTPPEVICELGVTACDGRALQLCTDGGTAWATLEVCETVDLCESSSVSTVSACLPPQCGVEQMSCDGNMLRLCNVMRTGWELFDACESPAHCDAGNRQCLPAPCEPGNRRCNVGNLERCNDDRTAWEPLDECETNELCQATLAPPGAVGELLGANQLQTPAANAEGPLACILPVCIPREVRCDVNRLMACNAGQTDLALFEECATPKLCEASITYTGLRGSPRCVRPTCAAGEHRCTETGVLEVCNADRDGYDPIEACIGSPFCNAVAADNGQPGCEDAPCDPREQQCNGAQIQVCTQDQTRFDPVGAPCETRGLCNDDNPLGAFCQAAACQRGPFSGSEFRCQGASLLRCNDQHTGFDGIGTCATPGLCNAALGFAGCQPPVCAPGETRCSGNFVQRCNEQRTGFDNIEQCAAGTCDSFAGRCSDPCTVGTARCNAQGNLEECRNLLTGREITGRCGSPQLCDATARTCRTPPAGCTADGVRRCRQAGATSVLEECTDGRSRFNTLDTCGAGEICDLNDIRCDTCQQGSQATCEGNNLVTCASNGQSELVTPCANGCLSVTDGPDRCRNCAPGSVSCEGRQLVVCRQGNGEEVLDRENCDTGALCQATIAGCTGEACRCETSACDVGERQCNGNQPEVCNAGQTGFVADGPSCGAAGCDEDTGRCFACAVGDVRCSAGQLQGCALDRSGFTLPLGTQRCLSDTGGERSQSCNGSQLIDTRCPNGAPVCVIGGGCQQCSTRPGEFTSECTTTPGGAEARTQCVGGTVQAVACAGDGDCVDAVCEDEGDCNTSSSPRGTRCNRGGGAGVCNGAPSDPACVECLDSTQCSGNRICSINNTCVECIDATRCNDGNDCTTDSCSPAGVCQHPARAGACNGDGVCSGTTCVECDEATDCGNSTECTVFSCSNAGTCQTTVRTGDDCSGGVCAATGACVECDEATDCGNSTECTIFSCSNAGTCQTATGTGACTLPNGATGSCARGECAPAIVCNTGDASCQGTIRLTCNVARTGFDSQDCAPGVCTLDGCVECVDESDCDGDQVCRDNDCVEPDPPTPVACNPATCPFPRRCNLDGLTCATCDNEDDCGSDIIDLASCVIRVCGANDCVQAPRNGECVTGGLPGICSDEICNPVDTGNGNGGGNPGNGGGNPGNGGGNPGNGNQPPGFFCNGICEFVIDAIACPEDCPAP
jgi:hypothetical protein